MADSSAAEPSGGKDPEQQQKQEQERRRRQPHTLCFVAAVLAVLALCIAGGGDHPLRGPVTQDGRQKVITRNLISQSSQPMPPKEADAVQQPLLLPFAAQEELDGLPAPVRPAESPAPPLPVADAPQGGVVTVAALPSEDRQGPGPLPSPEILPAAPARRVSLLQSQTSLTVPPQCRDPALGPVAFPTHLRPEGAGSVKWPKPPPKKARVTTKKLTWAQKEMNPLLLDERKIKPGSDQKVVTLAGEMIRAGSELSSWEPALPAGALGSCAIVALSARLSKRYGALAGGIATAALLL